MIKPKFGEPTALTSHLPNDRRNSYKRSFVTVEESMTPQFNEGLAKMDLFAILLAVRHMTVLLTRNIKAEYHFRTKYIPYASLNRPIRVYYAFMNQQMRQDVEAGYAGDELTTIKVQPNQPAFYPYQMPTQFSPMANNARSGTLIVKMVYRDCEASRKEYQEIYQLNWD